MTLIEFLSLERQSARPGVIEKFLYGDDSKTDLAMKRIRREYRQATGRFADDIEILNASAAVRNAVNTVSQKEFYQ